MRTSRSPSGLASCSHAPWRTSGWIQTSGASRCCEVTGPTGTGEAKLADAASDAINAIIACSASRACDPRRRGLELTVLVVPRYVEDAGSSRADRQRGVFV